MEDDPRSRVARAVTERASELGLTVAQLAAAADVDPTTIRAFIKGTRWPTTRTWNRIAGALGWDEAELVRRAVDGDAQMLRSIPTASLIWELQRRAMEQEL